ncbi:hypothetical protein [Aquimarina addita]
MAIIFQSCQSQSRTDLAQLTWSEDLLVDLIPESDRASFTSDKISPDTGIPIFYTKEVSNYKYENIKFEQTKFGNNSVGFYVYDALKKGEKNEIAGIKINIEKQNEDFFNLLKEKYGTPIILSPIPTKVMDGVIYGNSGYLWKQDKISIVLSDFYKSRNNEQYISTSIYIIKNDVVDLTSPERTSLERLIQTHTKK